MVLSWAAIRGDLVSLLKFLFLSYVQVLTCDISLVCWCTYSCFSPIFVFRLFLSVDPCVFCIVCGGCNESSYAVFFQDYNYFTPWEFFHILLMVFHWSLSDSKSPQVFRTLLCILADLNNAVVWPVSHPYRFIIIYSLRVFHISVSWWFFTGVWVIASLLKSPGLFSEFWPFSFM